MSEDILMNAFQTESFDPGFSDKRPVLIAASSEAALVRGVRTVEAAGGRIGAQMTLGTARERIESQISASAVWLELDRDCGGDMDDVLECIVNNVRGGRFAAVISGTTDLIDVVAAQVGNSDIELIVNADEAERIAALSLAMARTGIAYGVSDIASDQSAERLRQLSDEVSRIAATLARLSVGPSPVQSAVERPVTGDTPEISAERVRAVIRARRLRSRFFPEHLFADPAWDMLLDLLQAEIAQLRVPVSSLCIAAAVPATTALRWLKTMVQEGVFVRRADPHDGRRVFVELSPGTSQALRRYFAEVGAAAVI
jgi:DNA-binding MarR family transcriptional regulator